MIGIGGGIGVSRMKNAIPAALDLQFTSKNLDPRITFTRASDATYFDNTGTLRTAASNEARIEYDPATRELLGLKIEEARTNLITYSGDLSNAAWSASPAGSITDTGNVAIAPDGTLTATRIETGDTLSNGHVWFRTFTGAINTAYVGSLYVKAGEYSKVSISFGNTGFALAIYGALFDLATGTVVTTEGGSVAKITYVGNGWYRCSFTGTSDADGGNYVFAISPSPADDTTVASNYTPASTGLGIYVWGAQVEEGAFPTSYIPTVASTATRAADVASITGTNFSSWFNASEGTIFVDVRSSSTATPISHTLSDGTFNESIYGNFASGTSYRGANVLVAGAGQAASIPTFTGIVQSVGIRDAFAYKLNDFAEALNGSAATTDTLGTLPTVNRLYLGSNWAGNGNYLCGHIKRFTYYDTRLPNTVLQELTR